MIMRYRYYPVLCAILALSALWSCTGEKDADPVRYTAPEVTYDMPSDIISAAVGEKVPFSAKVVSGDKVSTSWFIDEVLVSGSQSFSHVFEAPGTFQVRFEARNGGGSVSRDFTVNVSDILAIKLSVGDSTEVSRLQLDYLKVAAAVEHGQGVTHEWSVDGVFQSGEAYFCTLQLTEARTYDIRYRGSNTTGVFEHSFKVAVRERPLEIAFSNTDAIIAMLAGRTLTITATALYGGTGLQQKWYLNDAVVSETGEFSHYFPAGDEFMLRYEAGNAKGETVTRSWKVIVTATGRIFDDFEYDAIGPWFNLGENQPGIELVDNPLKAGINTSDKCLRDKVYGTGGTSGYFTLKGPKMLSETGFDISEYSGVRFMVYLGQNSYYPRVDYGGVKYPSTTPPKFNNEWELLEYRLPEGTTFDNTKNIVFRMLLKENGSNISGGGDADPTNNRTVYIDNIEFFK